MSNTPKQSGLKPIIFDNPKILILGSLPSVVSIKTGIYFANRGNRFWSMISDIYGEKKPENKNEMNNFLKRHNIALWDVFASAVRKGSSDESMTDCNYNDIAGLLKKYPTIKKILVAGKKAQQGFAKQNIGIDFIPVPSTSGANAHFDKNEWYEAIKE